LASSVDEQSVAEHPTDESPTPSEAEAVVAAGHVVVAAPPTKPFRQKKQKQPVVKVESPGLTTHASPGEEVSLVVDQDGTSTAQSSDEYGSSGSEDEFVDLLAAVPKAPTQALPPPPTSKLPPPPVNESAAASLIAAEAAEAAAATPNSTNPFATETPVQEAGAPAKTAAAPAPVVDEEDMYGSSSSEAEEAAEEELLEAVAGVDAAAVTDVVLSTGHDAALLCEELQAWLTAESLEVR